METTETIHKWRCIRRFKQDEPVPEEALRKVLEAGRRTPSWENVQPWHFIVIEDAEMKKKTGQTCRRAEAGCTGTGCNCSLRRYFRLG